MRNLCTICADVSCKSLLLPRQRHHSNTLRNFAGLHQATGKHQWAGIRHRRLRRLRYLYLRPYCTSSSGLLQELQDLHCSCRELHLHPQLVRTLRSTLLLLHTSSHLLHQSSIRKRLQSVFPRILLLHCPKTNQHNRDLQAKAHVPECFHTNHIPVALFSNTPICSILFIQQWSGGC
jgi:hypothetical protein